MSELGEQPGVPTTFPTRRVRNPDAYTGDASRHHVGTQIGLHPEDRPYQTQDDQPEPQPQRAKARRQCHWSVYVGLTLLVGVVLFIVGSTVVSWWHIHQ